MIREGDQLQRIGLRSICRGCCLRLRSKPVDIVVTGGGTWPRGRWASWLRLVSLRERRCGRWSVVVGIVGVDRRTRRRDECRLRRELRDTGGA